MQYTLGILRAVLLFLVMLWGAEREARAYTDPGAGALIWQMLLAGFFGSMFYFRRLTSWLRSRKGPRD